jgi:serine/arginine repetitive matrix protein 2
VDVLIVRPDDFASGAIGTGSSIVQLHIEVLTEPLTPSWLESLQASARYTIRSLSFPTHSGKYLAHGSNVDLQSDTKLSVMSLLAVGLPVPKSPSLQLDELLAGHEGESRNLEREERGWWSLRFQQVQREVQRLEGPIAFAYADRHGQEQSSTVKDVEASNLATGFKQSSSEPSKANSSGMPERW